MRQKIEQLLVTLGFEIKVIWIPEKSRLMRAFAQHKNGLIIMIKYYGPVSENDTETFCVSLYKSCDKGRQARKLIINNPNKYQVSVFDGNSNLASVDRYEYFVGIVHCIANGFYTNGTVVGDKFNIDEDALNHS